jgi:hypothetical protein
MELRLESLCEEEEIVNNVEQNDRGFDDKTAESSIYKYYTREAYILPLNERTMKKRKDKAAEEERKKQQIEFEKKAEIEQKLRRLELDEKKKRQKEEEENKKKRQEKKILEEAEEIQSMVKSLEWQFRKSYAKFLLFKD